MKLFEFSVGSTKPDITGVFVGVDLTGNTPLCVLENLADGTTPFSGGSAQNAVITSATAARTEVRYTVPSAFVSAGEYIGWFVCTVGGQVYRAQPSFIVRITGVDRTPTAGSYPCKYGDGSGGYATVNDVMQLDVRRDGKTVKISDGLVETLLADTAVEIDSALKNLYIVPITSASPISCRYLNIVNKYWALAAVYDILAPGGGADFFSAAVVYREKGTQMIEDLLEGTYILPDATAASEIPLVDSAGATIAPEIDPEVDDHNTPIFSVDSNRRNWRLY